LDDEVTKKNVAKDEFKHTVGRCVAHITLFQIPVEKSIKIKGLDRFGKRSMFATRVHIGRNGRNIEAMKYHEFMGLKDHNSLNGKIAFIMFTGEELPMPCTTKVKMQEECPIFKAMKIHIKKWFSKTSPTLPKVVPAPPELP
jgi:hypothetical protein